LERERAQHEEATERLTGALESKKRIINQLSENNERRDVEVASLKTHADEQTRRIEALAAQLKKAEEAEASAKGLAKGFQQAAKVQKALRQKETRSVRVSTHNASTSTHQCASTQTDPEPKPSPAVGEKVMVESVPKPVCSYQAAIDMLQQLVSMSGNAPPQMVPTHAPPHMYPRPLPFPHFTPGHAPPYGFDPHGHPQYHSNFNNGRY
jgi:chromosome segregation ATPase